jgi:hypothetical protein
MPPGCGIDVFDIEKKIGMISIKFPLWGGTMGRVEKEKNRKSGDYKANDSFHDCASSPLSGSLYQSWFQPTQKTAFQISCSENINDMSWYSYNNHSYSRFKRENEWDVHPVLTEFRRAGHAKRRRLRRVPCPPHLPVLQGRHGDRPYDVQPKMFEIHFTTETVPCGSHEKENRVE